MKSGISLLTLAVMLVFISTVSATIVNDNAPGWRGNTQTTYQAWGFDTSINPSSPDFVTNIYAPPAPYAEVSGVDPAPVSPFDPYNTYWKENDEGHQGVWRIHGDSFMLLYVPNHPVQNEYKIINLQMTYYASGSTGANPELMTFTTPETTSMMQQISKTQIDDQYYYHVTWQIMLMPNPNEEWIKIQPRDCTIYVDEVIIDTMCVPEPMTVALIGLGGMFVRFKRR